MKKIIFLFFVIICFVSAPAASEPFEYETYVLLKETSKTAFGPCVELYDKNYKTPHQIAAPKVGFGLVAGNMGPHGWQITLTRATVASDVITGKKLSDIYGDSFDYSMESLEMQYAINTIKYEMYFNMTSKRTETASVERMNYIDVGFGIGLIEVRGDWKTTYVRPNSVRVVAKETVGGTEPFGTVSLRAGVKTEHLGTGLVISQGVGNMVEGFFPGLSFQVNMNVRW